MKLTYFAGTEKIDFDVTFRKRKSLSIQIDISGNVKVISPLGKSTEEIFRILEGKSKWILKKRIELSEKASKKRSYGYVNGEAFAYLGRDYRLQIIVDSSARMPKVELSEDSLFVVSLTQDPQAIKEILRSWYKYKAKIIINERISLYQAYFDIKPSKVIVKDQSKRWGSCTSEGKLLLNWKCLMMPLEVLDYIIIHEMCHLVHMNHSKNFWDLVKRISPDYETHKKHLKDYGLMYDLN